MEPKTSGLCINCHNSGNCYNEGKHNCAILFCEEFEVKGKTEFNKEIKKRDNSNEKSVTGLCQNCINNPGCGHKKLNNVIHCNEYRYR